MAEEVVQACKGCSTQEKVVIADNYCIIITQAA